MVCKNGSVKDFIHVILQNVCLHLLYFVFSDALPESYLMSLVIISEKPQIT